MRSGSLRVRVAAVTLVLVALALGGFATFVTLRYRDGLRVDLRTKLMLGATVLDRTSAKFLKTATHTLALEGIGVELRAIPPYTPVKPAGGGSNARRRLASLPRKPPSIERQGGVLTLEQPLEAPGISARATLTADASGIDSSVSRLLTAEVVGGLMVMLAVSLLLAWWLGVALSPLDHVGRVAGLIAAGGRQHRLNPRRPDTDLGRMAASFDAMVLALDEAAERAEASEAAMRAFLASAAHELRAPLAALQVTIETLLREQPPRPERDRLEARLARECTRLGQLVHDLLDLARLEAAEHRPARPVVLAAVVSTAVQDAPAGESRPVVNLDGSDSVTVLGEPEALRSAVRNLIENATTATGGTGRVCVDVFCEGEDAVVRVTDDGPGVPEQARHSIFEPFTRLDQSPSGHAGLGLAIVARIAEQHGGRVSCDQVVHGASFTLRLPSAPVASIPGIDGLGSPREIFSAG